MELIVWGIWVLMIVRGPALASLVTMAAERGTRAHRFWMDWVFVGGSVIIAVGGSWPSLWPRLALVGGITAVVTVWRLRSPDRWRLYDPPLEE